MRQSTRWLVQESLHMGCIFVMLLFYCLIHYKLSQWRQYREENVRLRIAVNKHRVATSIVQELHPRLAVTIGAYEELTEKVGIGSTLAVFHGQVGKVKSGKK